MIIPNNFGHTEAHPHDYDTLFDFLMYLGQKLEWEVGVCNECGEASGDGLGLTRILSLKKGYNSDRLLREKLTSIENALGARIAARAAELEQQQSCGTGTTSSTAPAPRSEDRATSATTAAVPAVHQHQPEQQLSTSAGTTISPAAPVLDHQVINNNDYEGQPNRGRPILEKGVFYRVQRNSEGEEVVVRSEDVDEEDLENEEVEGDEGGY